MEVGALISWCVYPYRIVMLLASYMWVSMTFLPETVIHHSYLSHDRFSRKPTLGFAEFCEVLLLKQHQSHFRFYF